MFARNGDRVRTDPAKNGHGTCVASKTSGNCMGVFNNSRLVMVKSSGTKNDLLSAFYKIHENIRDRGRQQRSVLVYPRTSLDVLTASQPASWDATWDTVRYLIGLIHRLGVVIVVSAGNDADRYSGLDTLPAAWREYDPDFPIISAGAVTKHGAFAKFSQGKLSSAQPVWAPGVAIKCVTPNPAGRPIINTTSGTSFAAPMVMAS